MEAKTLAEKLSRDPPELSEEVPALVFLPESANAIDDSPTINLDFQCPENGLCQKYRRAVVISHYDEPYEWINNIPEDIFVALYWRNSPDKQYNLNHNIGKEGSVYVDFILRHWDDLPEYTAFVHGHRDAWHNSGNIDELLTNYKWGMKPWMSLNYGKFHCHRHHLLTRDYHATWDQSFFRHGEFRELPYTFCNHCCAQFIVHRSLIYFRGKAFWETFNQIDHLLVEHWW